MKNVLIGSFLGAIVFFFWGFIYWSILPTGPMIFGKTSEEEVLAKQLKQSLPTAGTYYIPEPELMYSDEEEFTRRHQAGPVATIFIFPEGKPVMPARTFILGFVDDISIRVSGNRTQSRIDIRSASRYGTHDLGRNAFRG